MASHSLPAASRLTGVLLAAVSLAVTPFHQPGAAGGGGAAAKPNILIFLTDDQREGLEVMPETRAWLGSGGTRYANAFATTPLCCPSRASIFSGNYVHNHGVRSNTLSRALDQETTMQYYLDRAGYRTGMFGKYLNGWWRRNPPYFDRWAIFGGSGGVYSGADWNVQGTIKRVSDYATHFIGDQAEGFLASAPTQPWFLFLAPPNPHAPYTAEARYSDAPVPAWDCNPAVLESDRSDKPPYVRLHHRSCNQGESVRTKQLRTLMSVDDLVDRVLTRIKGTGELGNTLVFFLSDNGYLWSEHGLGGKRYPYLQSIQIPMFARWAGHLPAGAVDRRLVANIDVAPTVLDAANLTPTSPMDGRSLLGGHERDRMLTEYWSDSAADDAVPDWASLLTTDGHYIQYYDRDGSIDFTEYYNLAADPWELSNRSDPPAGWRAQLAADRTCAGRSCP